VKPDDLVARAPAGLLAFLPAQRWFRSKVRTLVGATPLDHASLPGTAGILALFDVAFADGGRETYLVPVVPDGGQGGFRDAMDDPAFCAALVEQIRLGARLPGRRGTFRCTPTEVLAEILPAPPEKTSRVRTEQSNTSVIFDKKGILKLFRRLQPGPNPDFEITDFLTRRTAFRGIARLAGSIVYTEAGGEETTLAILQEFAPNQGDAWTATLGRLAEYYAAALRGIEEGAGGEAFARTLAAADAEEARRLGGLTGRLHMALASGASEPAFNPESIEAFDVAAWQAGMQGYLGRVMEMLASVLNTVPAPVREAARQVVDLAPRFRSELEAVQALGEGVTRIRIHGDYHLGQVLKARESFVILDFEGEPARPLEERRAKQCALKDVAGMLRSFDYAVHAALFAAAEATPDDLGLAERLEPWAGRWLASIREAFLEGYLAETWEVGAPFLPRSREVLAAVLRVFELDKAIYEIDYEINNRPAWLRIPLEGLRRAVAPAPQHRVVRLHPSEGPFTFVACHELLEFVGVRAENERQLADLIEEVSLDSIYYHTHAFFLRHKFVTGAYPNDFATWVAVQVRDRVLGEQLAMVDPGEFATLEALREELVSVIDDHLRDLQIVPGVIFGEPFDFIQSRIVEIHTGTQVRTLQEFREALLEVDVSAIYFHLVEARLRLGRGRNDFAAWLDRGLDLPDLASRVRAVDPYAGSLERTRARLIQLCDEALAEGAGR
jgi:trehalose synthase-fused probable maltokinase